MPGGYFDYARKSGAEGDLTAMSRDSLSFAAARRIYLSGEPASAAKSLRSYLESYPKGYYTADALYCLSDCYLKTGERSPCDRNARGSGRCGTESVHASGFEDAGWNDFCR